MVVKGWGGNGVVVEGRKGDLVVRGVKGGGLPKGDTNLPNKCREFPTIFFVVSPNKGSFKKNSQHRVTRRFCEFPPNFALATGSYIKIWLSTDARALYWP